MLRRGVYLTFLFLFIFCFGASCAIAQEDTSGYEMKRKELRQRKGVVTANYKDELQKINNEYSDRLAEIKKNFHEKRDKCLGELKTKQDQLLEAHEKEMGPLLEEEKKLIEAMGPGASMNFAKPKTLKR